MCGRFTLRTPSAELVAHFHLQADPQLPLRFNIAPTQDVAVVRADGQGGRELQTMHWGLIPSWAKDPKVGNRMINARAETIAEKPSYRAAFRRRRCLVPADGYYEWQKTTGRTRQPYLLHRRDNGLIAFAGLWEHWDQGGGPLESCTIITTAANDFTRPIHDRMPVILSPEDYDSWLDPGSTDRDELLALLVPYTGDDLTADPVSTHVNKPTHDDPQCVEMEREP